MSCLTGGTAVLVVIELTLTVIEDDLKFFVFSVRCISDKICDIQFPRFQNIDFSLTSAQRPHLMKLMEVLCYSQLGVWAPLTKDKCLSASPIAMAPLMRRVTKIYQYYHYMHYYRYYLASSIASYEGIEFL